MDLGKFLRDRKKQVQGVVAQVNPFDGGKTYNTVVNNAPIKSKQAPQQAPQRQQQAPVFGPQQTPQQQQQQFKAPTLGSGNAFNNKIGGIDIQAPRISKPDQSKIQAATQRKAELDKQERLNKSEALKNLGKKYNTGQINRKQFEAAGGAILSDKKNVVTADKILAPKSGLDKTTNAIVGGFAESNPIKLAGDVIEFGGRAGEAVNLPGAKKIKNIGDKMNNFGDTQGTAMDGKYDSNIGLKVARAAPRLAQDTVLAIATGGGSAAPQLAGQASKLSKLKALLESGKAGTSLVGAIQGAQVANDISGDAEARGVNLKQAVGTGAAAGLVSGGVEKIGGDLLLNNPLGRKLGGNIASRALGGFVSEGSEEATQQVVENAARKTYNDEQKLLEGVPESFAVGGLMGAGAGTVTNRIQKNNISQQLQNDGVDKLQADKQADDIINNTNQNTPTPQVDPQVKQQLDSPDPVVQQTAQDKIAGQTLPKVTEMPTVQGMQERMRAAKQNVMESVSSFKDKYGIKGEGGFIAGPLAGDFSSFQNQGKVFEGVDGKPRFEVSDEGAKLNDVFDSANKVTNLEQQYGMMLQMQKMGVSNPEIDARLKVIPQEIRDAKRNARGSSSQKLSNVLDHPELYKQYPQLANAKVKLYTSKTPGEFGRFNRKTGTIELNKTTLADSPQEAKAQLLHEITHNIQEIEGFAKGTDATEGMDNYNRSAGEAEARAVAARKDMTDGERYVKPAPQSRFVGGHVPDKQTRAFAMLDGDMEVAGYSNHHGIWVDNAFDADFVNRLSPENIATLKAQGITHIEKAPTKTGIEYGNTRVGDNNYGVIKVSNESQFKHTTSLDFQFYHESGHHVWSQKMTPEDKAAFSRLNPEKSSTHKAHEHAGHTGGEMDSESFSDYLAMELQGKGDQIPAEVRPIVQKYAAKPDVRSTFYDSLDVPKKDLIIKNGEGTAMSIEPSTPTPQTPKAQGVEEDFVPTAGLSRKQKQLISEISKLEKKLGSQDGMPGTYITGRNGVSAKRVARQNASLERTIDDSKRLIDAQSELRRVNDSIERQRRQSLKPKKEKRATVVSDASKIRVSESDSLRLYDYGFGGDKKQQLAKYIDHLNKGGEPKQGLERINAQYMSVSKNQPGVHDSLADNLPNQAGNIDNIAQDLVRRTPSTPAPQAPKIPSYAPNDGGRAMTVEPDSYKYKNQTDGATTEFNKLDSTNSFQDINGIQHPFQSDAKITVKNLDGTNETRTFTVKDIGSQKYFNDQLVKYGKRGEIMSAIVDDTPALVQGAKKPTTKAPVAKTDPQASLKQEALKYKTADEFVKAQGEPVYHRSQNKFEKFDISKVSNDSNRQRYGWGLYFSDTIPHDQYGKNLYEARLPKGTFIDSKQPVDEKIVNRIVEAVKANNKNPSELDEFSYSGYLFYKTLSRILGGDKEASLFLSKNGIDGLKSNIGKNANDYILFNDKSIKTKQELTSLYNEAHSGKAMSVEPTDVMAQVRAKMNQDNVDGVEAARSIENFDPAEAKTIFKDVKTGDGEAGVVKALTDIYNKANSTTDTATDTAIEIPNASPEVVNEASNYKSQKEYINDLAKTARDLEQENKSGSIDLYNEKGAGNQGKQRYSAHNKFYSDYFKANGKKPPLYEYANAIEAELNGQGKSGMIPSVEDSKAVYNEIANQQQTALDNEAKVQQYTEADMPREVLLEQQLAEAQKRLAKKPRKPISQPVDTTPAIAKRVTQKENAEIAKLRKQIKNEKAQKQKKAAIEAKQRADRVAAKKAKLANKIPDTPKARAKVATNTIPDLFSKYLDHDNKGYNKLENEKGNIPVINKKGSYIESNRKTKDISRKNFKFAEESIAKGLHNMSKSDNKAARSIPRMLQYISKNAGQDPRMVEAASRFAGENTYTDSALLTLGEEAYKLLPDEASRERVHATLDPNSVIADMVKNKNNDYVEQRNAPKYDDLSKNEQKAADMLRDMGEAINDSSYRAGMISQEVWQKNKGGKYIARMYEDIKNSKDVVSEVGISESAAQQLFTGMYKSREKLNDALREKMLRDPVKLAVIRARQVRNNEALSNYVQEADSSGYISDKPKDGWVKVPYDQANNGHMFMNNWGGKFMRRDVYENINGYTSGSQAINHMNNILDLYDGNPARRLRKKLLTVYNPVVRTCNITSNYLFAYLNGVNPATFTANKRWAKSVMDNKKGGSKGSDPLYIEAQRQGLIGNSILRSDRNLFNTDKEWQRDIKNRNVKTKFTDKVRDKVDRFEKRYGEADDLSKLSALKTHVDRGHSVADAIEMTKRGFQDYNRVGHMYDMGAKSPVFGNAFIRFQGDLWTGILKNAAIDHPLRLAALPVATYAMGQALSGIMGEDEEDKETRENRAGAPKIPFTDISTEFQTPFGAFDASRFLGVYNREDLDGNDFTDEISKLLPFNVINPLKLNTAEGKTDAVSKMASDPLIGPLLSVLFDTDYRGKSISDPDGVRNGQELFPDEKLSDKDKWRNRRQYLVEAYMPYPYREGSDIVASSTEKMRNEQSVRGGKNDPSNPDASFLEREGYNNSGSKKTVGQSLARLFGVRLEQYGEDEAKTQRERNEMFSFFDEVDDWKETLDTETRKKFDSRHKSNTSRSGVAEEFADNPFYKYKNAAELRDDNLFNAEKKYAEMQNKKDGKPIDPLFNLPKDQRNMVLWKNSLPPGAKDDAVTAMYDQDWYEQFRNEQGKYFGAKDKYAEKRGFNKFTDTNPYPKPTDELQGVIDGYYDLSSGQRTSWRNKNPGLYQQMKDQFAKQDEWTNTERAALGLAPIEDKYGKYAKSGSSGGGGRGSGRGRGRGRGGGGSRGGSNAIAKSLASSYKLQADTLGKLNQLLNATTKKPTAGMNAGKKVATKKPTLKKITVNQSYKG